MTRAPLEVHDQDGDDLHAHRRLRLARAHTTGSGTCEWLADGGAGSGDRRDSPAPGGSARVGPRPTGGGGSCTAVHDPRHGLRLHVGRTRSRPGGAATPRELRLPRGRARAVLPRQRRAQPPSETVPRASGGLRPSPLARLRGRAGHARHQLQGRG